MTKQQGQEVNVTTKSFSCVKLLLLLCINSTALRRSWRYGFGSLSSYFLDIQIEYLASFCFIFDALNIMWFLGPKPVIVIGLVEYVEDNPMNANEAEIQYLSLYFIEHKFIQKNNNVN